ncbi:ABC transporter ATP-binding protein [Halorussus salinisoli]|uniref:ABC transporter ATP-binding protein n=1 Tax=Halorussus salinisoli TaxID=2558242 RepID=UPI0010C175B9|nr:ABC transporter ATP-binding protein [Halorussus salinisoli]
MTDTLLSVANLSVEFATGGVTARAVDGVSFDVERGETVCVVGESGSGKTVTCEAITRLTDGDVAGDVRFEGTDLLAVPEKRLREYRGSRIAYVFQNPQNTLDPVYTVGEQLAESIAEHADSEIDQRAYAVDLLDRVDIPDPAVRADNYPHEFSGGMKQRIAIARALAGDPDLLVVDEPTTALDVTLESQILNLLADIQHERDTAVLFVTHDMGVVAEIADRVVVMYGGKVMERGPVGEVFTDPAHPYTRALLGSLPDGDSLPEPIRGTPPNPTDHASGCRFHPRCDHVVDACRSGDHPPHFELEDDREVACVHYETEGRPTTALDESGGEDI